eukprot:SM000115S23950  [mRNA]  locus=s115:291818:293258:- [translate_table: standard]
MMRLASFEDDVHKSIKYGVWASTPNGNRRLDDAYREAQATTGGCPVFLFFSVNASGQFCGVAEMTGPVDFGRSVDYWQQDKWSGRFPVTWHLVKDVPNHALRHITLENNEGKPVTNSRDTQEASPSQASALPPPALRARQVLPGGTPRRTQLGRLHKHVELCCCAKGLLLGGHCQPQLCPQGMQRRHLTSACLHTQVRLALGLEMLTIFKNYAARAGGQENSESDVAPEAASPFTTAELRAALPETSDSVTTPEPATTGTVPPGVDLAGGVSDDVAVAAESSDADAPLGRQARAGEAANDQQ